MSLYFRIGIVLLLLASLAAGARFFYKLGVSNERKLTVETSLSRNAQRNDDDEALRNLDLSGLCREYGATRWVPERQGCE